MKEKIQRSQILAGAVLLGVLGAAGGLAWMGSQALQESQVEIEGLCQRMAKPELASILGQAHGVAAARASAKKLGETRAKLRGELETTIGGWRKGFLEASGAGQDWSKDTGLWKDELVQANADIAKASREAEADRKVRLAEDFYLGLEDFRQRSPETSELPILTLRLKAAEKLSQILFQARKNSQEQYPTECVLQKIVCIPLEGKKTPPSGGGAISSGESISRIPFELQFRASPEVLYAYLDLLRKDSWLFIVKDLQVRNELEQFPPRSEIRNRYDAQKKSEQNQRDGQEQDLLLVLAGKESLLIDLRIDFVAWMENPEASKSPRPGSVAPTGGAP